MAWQWPASQSPSPRSAESTGATACATRWTAHLPAGPRRLAPHVRHRTNPPGPAITVPDLPQILAAIDRHPLFVARDAAVILLGFAPAMRCCELAALTPADLETEPAGLLIHIRRSKTDQEAVGEVVAVATAPIPPRIR